MDLYRLPILILLAFPDTPFDDLLPPEAMPALQRAAVELQLVDDTGSQGWPGWASNVQAELGWCRMALRESAGLPRAHAALRLPPLETIRDMLAANDSWRRQAEHASAWSPWHAEQNAPLLEDLARRRVVWELALTAGRGPAGPGDCHGTWLWQRRVALRDLMGLIGPDLTRIPAPVPVDGRPWKPGG